jgi:hypothetical protein
MSNSLPHGHPVLSLEVIERSLTAPENCVMHHYRDGKWGWRFDPIKFRRLRREARRRAEAKTTEGADP